MLELGEEGATAAMVLHSSARIVSTFVVTLGTKF